ncbi:sulfide:quinone oxidoreductase [Actinokineospora alba]|uniref:Sulfide:quinone oxidoreductase n=1 Tax=Actinokineospora alba TaxID=504798 RepID=A0A1H0FLB8_9PSEU|nr:FAD-dependent oxidoreductase [Actinokineospora alba]TDP69526.1 sulfide:quinone oxidoreductase [Actinokineospora alba]SDI14898.1 sulfide:quinone oxidoreductase [Actinokineospora alba]SDN95475.1 sulfide:quinone oxidoreductase [Actinokineospora alba]
MAPKDVVVLGAGFAGLETAFQLAAQLTDDQVATTVVSDRDDFLFKPNTIYLPFGAAEAPLHIPLAKAMARRDIRHRIGTVTDVDVAGGRVHLTTGLPLHYDRLVIATGAAMAPEEVPGLAEHAYQVWTSGQLHRLGEALQWAVADARYGRQQRVVFLVPPGNKCAGPLYELAFMLDTWLRRRDVRHQVEVVFRTYEHTFVQAFGPRLHEVVTAEFADRDVDGRTGAVVTKVGESELLFEGGTEEYYDLLVAFPPYVASVRYEGLAADDRGFLTCDPASRALVDHPEIFAPGDAGDFPVKQAFLAFLQADAAAGAIAAEIRGTAPADAFSPTGMCVMEMFDKATFAQVPLIETGDPSAPVAVNQDQADAYRVGTSPIWRLGKKALGLYLPMRFRRGLPFHSGLGWRAMEVALRVGARTLAR